MSAIIINISEAKTNLSKFAQIVKKGKTVILADRNIPFAQIVPLTQNDDDIVKKRKNLLGSHKGKVTPRVM